MANLTVSPGTQLHAAVLIEAMRAALLTEWSGESDEVVLPVQLGGRPGFVTLSGKGLSPGRMADGSAVLHSISVSVDPGGQMSLSDFTLAGGEMQEFARGLVLRTYFRLIAGNDTALLGDTAEAFAAQGGNDTVFAGGGADTVSGDAGDDALWGEAGNDLLSGNDGNDIILGGEGNDSAYGGTGSDLITGGDGADLVVGWEGGDLLDGASGDDEVHGEAGDDVVFGRDGNDTLSGGDGSDIVMGEDMLGTGTGNDLLTGGAGADTLGGGAGSDQLLGEGESDILLGGAGVDTLDGGAGQDLFVYTALADFQGVGSGPDVISGLETTSGQHDGFDLRVLLDGLGAPDVSVAALRTAGWLRVTQSGADALLQLDGTGGADGFVTVARLLNTNAGAVGDHMFLV